MNFLSLEFVIFFAVLIVALCFIKNKRYQHIILLVASYIFYGLGDIRFLGLLIIVSVMMWFIGQKINLANNPKRKKYLGIGVIFDLIVLGIFKYFNFFVEGFASILGMQHITLKIILPVGISFYIFQSISYIADIYTGKIKPQRLLGTLLYIGFFPQIVSGPIVKAHDFFPQMEKEQNITFERLSWGLQRFALGMFKKTVIADRLGVCVDSVYYAPSAYSGLSLLIAVFSYALQIYYDFSGYSDMAIGVAYILGFDYENNFNIPYLAKNPSDFWRRWHISLSSWFRDYVYIPLGGNRRGKIRTYLNLFVTMLLSGLWHGASWAFVLWGAFHAIVSVVHKWYCEIRGAKRSHHSLINSAVCVTINFVVVSVLWIPFRTNSLAETILILKCIFTWSKGIRYVYIFAPVFAALLLLVEVIAVLKNDGNDIWKPLNLTKFCPKIVFCIFLLLMAVFAYVGNGAFIYAQF